MFEHGSKHWSTLKKLIWLKGAGIIGGASGIWKTVSGSLIHITDALASPMQKCEVSLEPIQEGSGDPSPTNVRPITGWTGCEVWVKDEYDTTLPPTLSVTFPDTVYGGSHEFVSGGLKSKMASVDLGTLTWSVASSAQSGKGRFTATLAGVKMNLNTETVPNIKCSELKPITPTQAFNNNDGITISASSEIVIAYVDSLAKVSAADFKTAMSGVQLVYELAEPIEIQLTPQQIATLKGENNIWSNSNGTIELTYKAKAS